MIFFPLFPFMLIFYVWFFVASEEEYIEKIIEDGGIEYNADGSLRPWADRKRRSNGYTYDVQQKHHQ